VTAVLMPAMLAPARLMVVMSVAVVLARRSTTRL
jgi:hypothetical protein